ncbi:hypothetical protein LguiB_002259 [Lonicera macranthoides]
MGKVAMMEEGRISALVERRPPANISFPLRDISSGLTLEGGTPGAKREVQLANPFRCKFPWVSGRLGSAIDL